MPYSRYYSENQERLSALIQSSRDRQSRNLDQLRRNIAAAESPAEGLQPRSEVRDTSATTHREEPEQSASRERQRLAQVRLTIPLPPLGTPDFSDSILDRVAARYASLRRPK